MTMEVKNKQYEEINLKKLKDKHPDIPKNLFPELNHKIFSFEIKNTHTSFANAIRRCCLNENNIKYLNVVNIFTNDNYQINQVLEHRLNQIPLLQSIDKNKKFILHVKNTTSDNLDVYSKDIKLNENVKRDKNTEYEREHKQEYKQDSKRSYKDMYDSDEEEQKEYKHDSKKEKVYFNRNIKVCTLRSNCSIKIDFDIKESSGVLDGKYSFCCEEYDILDADYTVSTVNQNNKHFYLSIESFGNIEPQEIIDKSCILLTERLDKIKNNLIKNRVNIIKIKNIEQYLIINESHTISNLLKEYIYQLNPDIELVNSECITVPDDKFYLNIIHNNSKKIILDAIDKIQSDLSNFNKQIQK